MPLHLLDGVVGRTLALVGVALLLVPTVWCPAERPHRWVRYGVTALFIGALIELFSAAVAAALPPFRSRTTMIDDLRLAVRGVPMVLESTSFGRWWLARCALLLVVAVPATLTPSPVAKRILKVLVLPLTLTLSATGHAAEHGAFSVLMALHGAHFMLVALWIAGLVVSAWRLLCEERGPLAQWLPGFSRGALFLFPAIVFTGVLRTAVALPEPSVLWREPYGWVVFAKMSLVIVLLPTLCALRALVPQVTQREPRMKFERTFSLELFYVALLLLLSGLLSQLPLLVNGS